MIASAVRARARAGSLLALVALVAACATARQDVRPIAPLAASDARSAWNELLRIRRSSPRLASYASIRVEARGKKQSFRATIEADGEGRLRVDAFTPMGTAAFTLHVDGGESTMIDHVNRTWWRGPFATASRSLGLPDSLDARGLAMLAFGLPASAAEAAIDGERVAQNGIEYVVETSGIAEAGTGEWVARFDEPAYPATGVTIVTGDGERSMSVRHLEVGAASRAIVPPKIDRSYRCCVEPAVP